MNFQSSSASRRFWQYSLRQLLAFLAILGILLSILAPRLHRAFQSWQVRHAEHAVHAVQGALSRAISQGQGADLVRKALEAGANPSLALADGRSLLHAAIELGQCDSVQVLLDYGADAERIDRYRRRLFTSPADSGPALFAAVACDQPAQIRIRMVRILLAHGCVIRREVHGFNAMDIAVLHGDGEMGDFLREHGLSYGPREMAAFNRLAELQRVIQTSPDVLTRRFRAEYSADSSQRSTLLGIALNKGYRDMALFLIEMRAPLNTVESIGDSSRHNRARGQTPLHIAALGDDPGLIRVLAARGVDVNARDDHQNTPLTAVINYRGRAAATAALIEAGADVNALSAWGTPLYIAVYNSDTPVITMLLKAGADPSVPNRRGESALALARGKSPELLELLRSARPPSKPGGPE